MPITPRTLSGFKDRLPKEAYAKSQMLKSIIHSFEKFGFSPIETPHLEYAEILQKQGSDEIQKEMYCFKDHGNREVALRFDLTLPLARFITQYKSTLGLPFKRYCIGNVFRGERAQKGRYREFTQCDFDFIGTTSVGSDLEILEVIYQTLKDLKIQNFTIYINHRKIFNGLCEYLNAKDYVNDILRIIDKIDKIGKGGVECELKQSTPLNQGQINSLFDFIAKKQTSNAASLLQELQSYKSLNAQLKEGIEELESLCALLSLVIPQNFYAINLSIARGLGYYTGIVYETILNDLPSLGSVCSGGRYDKLTQNFAKEELSGVGASIGLDRLLSGLEELGLVDSKDTPANLLIIPLYALDYAYKSAKTLRELGLKVEVYPGITKAKKAFTYANNKGYEWVLVLGEEEQKEQSYSLKNMQSGIQEKYNTLQSIYEKLRLSLQQD